MVVATQLHANSQRQGPLKPLPGAGGIVDHRFDVEGRTMGAEELSPSIISRHLPTLRVKALVDKSYSNRLRHPIKTLAQLKLDERVGLSKALAISIPSAVSALFVGALPYLILTAVPAFVPLLAITFVSAALGILPGLAINSSARALAAEQNNLMLKESLQRTTEQFPEAMQQEAFSPAGESGPNDKTTYFRGLQSSLQSARRNVLTLEKQLRAELGRQRASTRLSQQRNAPAQAADAQRMKGLNLQLEAAILEAQRTESEMHAALTEAVDRNQIATKDISFSAKLGEGAMGQVLLASVFGVPVVIKVLKKQEHQGKSDDPAERERRISRFSREARVGALAYDESLAATYGLVTLEMSGKPVDCILQEYIPGQTLEEYCEEFARALSLRNKIKILLRIAKGLATLHEKGIIHRDLKPTNVMVRRVSKDPYLESYEEAPASLLIIEGPNGIYSVKIIDFGLAFLDPARASDSHDEESGKKTALTQDGMVIGTPQFMSPEQAFGHRLTTASDVFAFAGVFYYVLTGKMPFSAANGACIAKARIPREILASIPYMCSLFGVLDAEEYRFQPVAEKVIDSISPTSPAMEGTKKRLKDLYDETVKAEKSEDTAMAVLLRIANEPFPTLPAAMGRELQALLVRISEKKAEKRMPMNDVVAELERILAITPEDA